MKKVVGYCRVSTDAQAGEDRFGIESQKEQIMVYCAANDMQISAWYIDEGESGIKENRPELDLLLFGEIKNPPIEAVVVAKSDRIARSIRLYYYYMMLLNKKGMQLISATEEVVNDETGLGDVYKSLMLFVADEERKNIIKRTSGGRTVKARQGGYSGGKAPYGYNAVRGGKRLTVNDAEAKMVRRIFELRDQGITMGGICERLKQEGYNTRSGGAFQISTIQYILGNRNTYKGMYKYGKRGEWVNGVHEAIL